MSHNPDKFYYVVGGVYKDTTFTEIKEEPEEYGPFWHYGLAFKKWAEMSWRKVDNCHHKLSVIQK